MWYFGPIRISGVWIPIRICDVWVYNNMRPTTKYRTMEKRVIYCFEVVIKKLALVG